MREASRRRATAVRRTGRSPADLGPPVRRGKLSQEIVERLIANILEGKFAFGEKLPPERDLARYLDVGRPTLREAIGVLSAIGLIDVRHGQGMFIVNEHADFVAKALSWVLLLDPPTGAAVTDARIAVEAGLAGLAAERATEADLARLRDSLKRLAAALGQPARLGAAETDLHLAIARSARSGGLQRLLEAIRLLDRGWIAERLALPGGAELALQRYREVVQSIAARNPLAAREAMRSLLVGLAERQSAGSGRDAASPGPDLAGDERYRLPRREPLAGPGWRRSWRGSADRQLEIRPPAEAGRLRIGMITPSSNTVVEPVVGAMTAHLIDALSVHYGRIPVTKISLERDSLDQFDLERMLDAARLLADA